MIIPLYRVAIEVYEVLPDGSFREVRSVFRTEFDPWPEFDRIDGRHRIVHSGGLRPAHHVEVPDGELVDVTGFPIGGLCRRLVVVPWRDKPLDAGQVWSKAHCHEAYGYASEIMFCEASSAPQPEGWPAWTDDACPIGSPKPPRRPIEVVFGPFPTDPPAPTTQLGFGWAKEPQPARSPRRTRRERIAAHG